MSCQLTGPSCCTETDVSGYLISVIGHRAHSVTSTRSSLWTSFGRRFTWWRTTCRSCESFDVKMRHARNFGALMCDCSHTHAHTCSCYVLSHVQSRSSTHHLLLLQGAIFELRRCLSWWRNPLRSILSLNHVCGHFTVLKSYLKFASEQSNCAESVRELSAVVFPSDGPISAPTVAVVENKKEHSC